MKIPKLSALRRLASLRQIGWLAARVVALPTDSLTPRLSWAGAGLIFASCAIFGTAVGLTALVADISKIESQQAERRMHELERVLNSVQTEFNQLLTQWPALTQADAVCNPTLQQGLIETSLASEVVKRYLWLAASGKSVCTPGAYQAEAPFVTKLRAVEPDIRGNMRLLQSDSGLLYLVRVLSSGGVVAAEVSPPRWRQPLVGVDPNLPVVLALKDWRGKLLHSTDAQGGKNDPLVMNGAIVWLADRIKQSAYSTSYRLTLEVSPQQSRLSEAIVRRSLSVWVIAFVVSLMLVSAINRRLQARYSVVRRLRTALRRREFEPALQPLVEADSGRCIGAEVLMRWRHPIRGLLGPGEFLAIAEQTGLIADMTWLLMAKSRARLDELVRSEPTMVFSFNFGVQMLRDPAFIDRLNEMFADSAVAPHNIGIELLERDAVDDRSIDMLAQLRRIGYRVSIDDFGTGQSSLALLSQIGFDTLKIDREFVRAIDGESMNRPVLVSIIELANRLGVRTTAEGVETEAQHQYLLAHGVNFLQGFLIAKPMPIGDFFVWLRANRVQPSYASDKRGKGFAQATKPLASISRPVIGLDMVHPRAYATHDVARLELPRNAAGNDLDRASEPGNERGTKRASGRRESEPTAASPVANQVATESNLGSISALSERSVAGEPEPSSQMPRQDSLLLI